MNRYYVYAHYNKITGDVFYIGKGVGTRASRFKRNNKNYNYLVDQIGKDNIGFKILANGLSYKEAIVTETAEIKSRVGLVNVLINHSENRLSKQQLECFFVISDKSASGLLKVKYNPIRTVVCGKIDGNGYWTTIFDKKKLFIHRIVATLHFGCIPENMVVNHKDGNKLNNSVSNLEICTVAENNRHARGASENKTVYPLVIDYGNYYKVSGILRQTEKTVERVFKKTDDKSLSKAIDLSNLCY